MPLAASQNPVPQLREPPAFLDSGVEQSKHQYDLPANTAGQSKVRNVPILQCHSIALSWDQEFYHKSSNGHLC